MPRRSTLLVAAGAAVIGFLVVTGGRPRPANPAVRLPQSARLADLITAEQAASAQLQRQADDLRRSVAAAQAAAPGAGSQVDAAVARAASRAGIGPSRGPGLRVTLNDSTLAKSATARIDDLVIHSQDVQAVVNALWRAGAVAISINDQRLVTTSAVLCVGNTLLLDGTVHSPPYVAVAVGANRGDFEAEALVRRLHHDADIVHLGFSVERSGDLIVPGFTGPVAVHFATPTTSP